MAATRCHHYRWDDGEGWIGKAPWGCDKDTQQPHWSLFTENINNPPLSLAIHGTMVKKSIPAYAKLTEWMTSLAWDVFSCTPRLGTPSCDTPSLSWQGTRLVLCTATENKNFPTPTIIPVLNIKKKLHLGHSGLYEAHRMKWKAWWDDKETTPGDDKEYSYMLGLPQHWK